MLKDLSKKGNMTKILIISAISGFVFSLILVALGGWLESEFGFGSFMEIVFTICIIILIILVIAFIILSVAELFSLSKSNNQKI